MSVHLVRVYQQLLHPKVQFAYIYVEEAHAKDEWPLGTIESYNQPKTLKERIDLAQHFKKKYVDTVFNSNDITRASLGDLGELSPIPVFVDTMENHFEQRYSVWPERFFIIDNGKFELIGTPTTVYGYDRADVFDFLVKKEEEEEQTMK